MSVYSQVGNARPGRSVFQIGGDHKFTMNMGQLYPIFCRFVMPGDKVRIRSEQVIRFQPLNAPILHSIVVKTHWWFGPNRLLWKGTPEGNFQDNWETYITNSIDGDLQEHDIDIPQPRFTPNQQVQDTRKGTLWDAFGLPTGVYPTGNDRPLLYPWTLYNWIWNENYRAEDIQNKVPLNQNEILYKNWGHDYFTSATPWQQKGDPIALPVEVLGDITFDNPNIKRAVTNQPGLSSDSYIPIGESTDGGTLDPNMRKYRIDPNGTFTPKNSLVTIPNADAKYDMSHLNNNEFNGIAPSFDIADLRTAIQMELWKERNARAGTRYKEYIKAHFNEEIGDARVDRPEFIGGTKAPMIISEVVQTSENGSKTPQGNMAGHGLSASATNVGTYKAREFGWVMGLMTIIPKAAYSQGIPREMLYNTRYDYPHPEFMHLSEQEIFQKELYVKSNDEQYNNEVFGFIPRYNELRSGTSKISGDLRDTYDYWHLARKWNDPDTPPRLNDEFLRCKPDPRIMAVPSEPEFIINVGNNVKCVRPMPKTSEPGLLDHSF